MAHKFCKSLVKVGDTEKLIVQIQHTPDKEVKIPQQIHHIHLIDRSGSMRSSINTLIEQVKLTLKSIPTTDLFSLGWFSGENQYAFVVKAMAPDNPKLPELLDTLKSTVALTCFSDIIAALANVIEETTPLCPNFNISLFTDGAPCLYTRNLAQEIELIDKNLATIYPKVIAFNTIGYGDYYDKDLLKRWADGSQFGIATHSNNIVEYLDIFQHNYEIINDLSSENVKIMVPPGGDIVYMTKKFTKCSPAMFNLSNIDKKQNTFYLVLNPKSTQFEYQGIMYNVNDITRQISSPSVTNFLYAYAADRYYNGRRRDALDIMVKSLQDKYCAELIMNSFSVAEIQFVNKWLQKFALNKALRHDDVCPVDFVPAKDAFCLLDMVQYLSRDPNNRFVPAKDYERIGLQTIDVDDKFNKVMDVPAPFADFAFNKDKYNLSIRYTISGYVEVNKDAAKKLALPVQIPCKLYRFQTLVLDGHLHLKQITALLTSDTLKYLKSKMPANSITTIDGTAIVGMHEVIIDLTAIPIINMRYAELGRETSDVVKMVCEQRELEIKSKVLKGLIKEDESVAYSGTTYNEAQVDFLKTIGVSKDGSYNPVNRLYGKATDDDADYYISRSLTLGLKGFSALPSYNEMMKTIAAGKKLNPGMAMMVGCYEHYKDMPTEKLVEAKVQCAETLEAVRYDIAGMKLAKLLNGDWFEGVIPDAEGNMLYKFGDETLVIKATTEKVYFTKK